MNRPCIVLALAATASLVVLSAPRAAQARPPYLKVFTETYSIAEANELKCGVCHGGEKGKNKKVLSDYAKAVKDALIAGGSDADKPNEKDPKKIEAALKAVESKDAGDGKTYGDILKDGKLPAPATEE